jgi:Holliday junction DNA helicase RuvA
MIAVVMTAGYRPHRRPLARLCGSVRSRSMLARLTGVIEAVEGGKATIAVAALGVAYEAHLPALLSELLAGRIGETVTLHTVQIFDSANQGASFTPRLLAFASAEDRRFFELLTGVKGLGPRKALRSMAAPTAEIARAIVERDVRALQALPEIGKKLAETLALELGEKAAVFAAASAASGPGGASIEGKPSMKGAAVQAVGALVRLGESQADAERMVRAALEADPALTSPDAILALAFARRG